MFDFIRYRKVFYVFSLILVIASIVSISLWKLNFGIDFKGGSLLVVTFEKNAEQAVSAEGGAAVAQSQTPPTNQDIVQALSEFNLGDITVQTTDNGQVYIRMKDIDEETHQKVLEKLKTLHSGATEQSFEQVGPAIGNELKKNAIYATIMVLIVIMAFISYSFRKISRKVQSYKYGVTANIALFHDLLVTVGTFAVLGHFKGVEVGLPFVAAVLTVLGYSMNDTIVVFDRMRENLLRGSSSDLKEVCNHSLNQTVVRSISTSLVTLVALLSVYFFGGATIKYFSLALIVGISVGTYSSIFIATTTLYDWETMKKARK